MKRTIYILFSLLILTVTSCEIVNPDPCSEERETAAIISYFPDSIKVGNTHTLEVAYIKESNCGEFERFDVAATDKTFEVKLITKYEGCNCNPELAEASAFFDIDLDFPGVYEFRFWQADGDYDIRTVTIFE